jgi:release factor glutamine methyltransferase
MNRIWTVLGLLNWAAPYLEKYGSSSPRLDAELLLARVLECPRLELYLRFDQPLAAGELAAFKQLLVRRREGVPVAYLLGEKEFWSLPFIVNPAVLVPRPETEHLVETALEFLRSGSDKVARVLDIGTGCGNIILALAHTWIENGKEFSGVGTDRRPEALEVARANARQLGIATVAFEVSDLFAALAPENGRFGLIVSNPPYIRTADLDTLPPEVRHEPRSALDGGADGLEFYRRIAACAGEFLNPGGGLFFEVGAEQAAGVKKILASCGYDAISSRYDLAGHERVVGAIKAE